MRRGWDEGVNATHSQILFEILNRCLPKPQKLFRPNPFKHIANKLTCLTAFPDNPSVQLQVYPLMPSTQVPPFSQRLLAQSSMSIELNEIVNMLDHEM